MWLVCLEKPRLESSGQPETHGHVLSVAAGIGTPFREVTKQAGESFFIVQEGKCEITLF